jgi:DNA-directed RNA polymerase subunit H (RpoH/RPB5)
MKTNMHHHNKKIYQFQAKKYNPQSYLHNVKRLTYFLILFFVFPFLVLDFESMLRYRGWIDDERMQEARENLTTDSDTTYIDLLKEGLKVKVVINLTSEAIDTSYIENSLKREEGVRTIFIYNHEYFSNPKLKFKNYDKPKDSKDHIEILSLKFLIINLSTHSWVSPHTISDKTLDIFKPGALWDSRLLMTIYHSDPMARYCGARIDDIIKIVTEDQIKYRKVIYGYASS